MTTFDSALHHEGAPILNIVIRVGAGELLEDLADKRIRLATSETRW